MIDNKKFILEWNSQFPLDRWWRLKYKVPFNSEKHRNISYIDIFYEWLEDNLIEQSVNNEIEFQEKQKEYQKTGKWVINKFAEEKEKELLHKFDDIDISQLNFDNIDG